MKLRDVLTADSWCKRASGLNAAGDFCGWNSPECVRRCLSGAIQATYGHAYRPVMDKVRAAIATHTGGARLSVVSFNDMDGTTWEDIDKVLQLAGE